MNRMFGSIGAFAMLFFFLLTMIVHVAEFAEHTNAAFLAIALPCVLVSLYFLGAFLVLVDCAIYYEHAPEKEEEPTTNG